MSILKTDVCQHQILSDSRMVCYLTKMNIEQKEIFRLKVVKEFVSTMKDEILRLIDKMSNEFKRVKNHL